MRFLALPLPSYIEDAEVVATSGAFHHSIGHLKIMFKTAFLVLFYQ